MFLYIGMDVFISIRMDVFNWKFYSMFPRLIFSAGSIVSKIEVLLTLLDIMRSNLSSISMVTESMVTNLQLLQANLTTSEGDINGTAFGHELERLSGNGLQMREELSAQLYVCHAKLNLNSPCVRFNFNQSLFY